jgi:hypothetical protein
MACPTRGCRPIRLGFKQNLPPCWGLCFRVVLDRLPQDLSSLALDGRTELTCSHSYDGLDWNSRVLAPFLLCSFTALMLVRPSPTTQGWWVGWPSTYTSLIKHGHIFLAGKTTTVGGAGEIVAVGTCNSSATNSNYSKSHDSYGCPQRGTWSEVCSLREHV